MFIHAAHGPASNVTIKPIPGSNNVPITTAAISASPIVVAGGKSAMANAPISTDTAMITARPCKGAGRSMLDERGARGARGEDDASKSLIPKSGCENTQSSG